MDNTHQGFLAYGATVASETFSDNLGCYDSIYISQVSLFFDNLVHGNTFGVFTCGSVIAIPKTYIHDNGDFRLYMQSNSSLVTGDTIANYAPGIYDYTPARRSSTTSSPTMLTPACRSRTSVMSWPPTI